MWFSPALPLLVLLSVSVVNGGTSSTYQTNRNSEYAAATHYPLVVIGAGSGGLACARRAVTYGVEVAIIEQSLIGGTCVNWGCMPKKVMWLAADAGETFKAFPYYGYIPSSSCSDEGENAAAGTSPPVSVGGAAPARACDSEGGRQTTAAAAGAPEGELLAVGGDGARTEGEGKAHKRRCSGGICFSWSQMRKHRTDYLARLRSTFQQLLKNEGISLFAATASFLPAAPAASSATQGIPKENVAADVSASGGTAVACRLPREEEAAAEEATAPAGGEKISSASETPYYRLLLTFRDGSTKTISAEHVVIATGARRLRATHIRGAEFTSTTDELLEMEQMPRKLAVLGSSYSATEFSSILAALGIEVHLFFRAPRVLARVFDEDATRVLETEMERSGVTLHRGVQVMEVAPSDADGLPASATYTFSSSASSSSTSSSLSRPSSPCLANLLEAGASGGSQQQQEQQRKNERPLLTVYLTDGQAYWGFDAVVSALGVAPAVECLELQNVGVELQTGENKPRFIIVDKFQNTTAPRIYAVGDVTGRGMLASTAVAAGRLLADRLFGGVPGAFLDLSSKSSVIFSYPPIAGIGMTETAAVDAYGKENIQVYTSTFISTFYGPWPVDRSEKRKSFVKLICLKKDERILGLQIVGRHAEEVLQGFAVAFHLGARKRDLDNTLAIHPTSAEEVVTLQPWRKSPVTDTT